MPRRSNRILEIAAYLYPSTEDAERGEPKGGTGFLVGIKYPNEAWGSHKYIVTCRHVAERGEASAVRMNDHWGRHCVLEVPQSAWEYHEGGYDVAACEVDISGLVQHKWIPMALLFTDVRAMELQIGIGDDIHSVSRYISQEGRERNTPVVRHGHIAMMPREEIVYNCGAREYKQLLYMLEIRSRPGFSGSPVMVDARPTPIPERPQHWELAPQLWEGFHGLLGMECAAAMEGEINEGMAWAIPAGRILEVLNMPRFQKSRDDAKASKQATDTRQSMPTFKPQA